MSTLNNIIACIILLSAFQIKADAINGIDTQVIYGAIMQGALNNGVNVIVAKPANPIPTTYIPPSTIVTAAAPTIYSIGGHPVVK